jgi:hypothetical protein
MPYPTMPHLTSLFNVFITHDTSRANKKSDRLPSTRAGAAPVWRLSRVKQFDVKEVEWVSNKAKKTGVFFTHTNIPDSLWDICY